MSDFTPITTQEEFDAAIGPRIKRERETVTREFQEKLDTALKENAECKEKITGYEKSLGEAEEKIKGHDKVVADLKAQVSRYEADSVKTRIAHEVGIPHELASRLSGEDEEAIRKDAECISKLLGQQGYKAPPLRSTEEGEVSQKQAAYKTMLNNLTGGE